MKMLRALKGHSYAGEFRKPGAIYKAANRDAKVLTAIGRSEIYVEPPKPAPKAAPKAKAAPKRTYQRKDMKAEDE